MAENREKSFGFGLFMCQKLFRGKEIILEMLKRYYYNQTCSNHFSLLVHGRVIPCGEEENGLHKIY